MDQLGIDLSKEYFDVRLLNEQREKQPGHFDNTPSGFSQLVKWLKATGVMELRACMAATNIYWEGLAEHLDDQGYRVHVVNPARIKGHAMSQLRRSKTDKLASKESQAQDGHYWCRHAQTHSPSLRCPKKSETV